MLAVSFSAVSNDFFLCWLRGLCSYVPQMNLEGIYRTFSPNTKECIFFSAPHATFSKVDHILSHKASLNRSMKIEITIHILSDHHKLKPIINKNRKNRRLTNLWKLKNSLLNENVFILSIFSFACPNFCEAFPVQNCLWQESKHGALPSIASPTSSSKTPQC